MPDIQAQTPDGVVHSFPDGTAPDVITGAIKKYLGVGAAPRPSEAELVANRPSKTAPMPDLGERADSPLGKLAQGQEAETLGNADVAREWWKRGPAELGSGVKGFTSHGPDAEGPHPYARSFNRMVSGAGVTALPAIANLLPMAAVEAPAATALSLGTGAAAQTGVEKGGELLGADPEVAKAAGNVAGIVGASLGPKLPDVPGAVQIAKEDFGRAARVEPTADTVTTRGTLDRPKSVSTLKPGVKAVASLGKLVGGPEVANALIPEHPAQIGPFSRIPDRIPETPDPVAEAVRSHTASWIPTKVPEAPSTSLTESPYYNDIAAARAAAREDASNALINRPGWVAKLPARVGSGEGGTQGGPVNLIPEPRETVPSDRPGSMWSIKRSKQLPSAAQRGTPGAGEVLQNIGKPVLYTPREGVGYSGPRSEPADLGPQSQTLKAPASQPSQAPALEPMAARDRVQEDLRDYPGNHPGDDSPTETRERQPREQLGKFDADTLQEAKDAVASAHEQWQQFERPGRYVIDTGGEKDYGSDMRRPENSVYSITSARPQIEAAHPWIRNLPKLTSGKLRSAVEAGKGVEYTRLVNEAAGQIQRAKQAAAPVLEEYRGQLEDAAKSVEKVDPDLAQTLRDLAAGKYAGMRGHTAYLREKLNEAATADAFDKVFSESLSEEISGGAQELGPEAHQPRETNQQAAELGPQKTLPGLESAVQENKQSAAVELGRKLTEKVNRPAESFNAAAGEMETKSPLFRGSEASPQNEMFASSAKTKEPWEMTQKEFIAQVRGGRDFKQLGVNPDTLEHLRGAKAWEGVDRQARNYHEGQTTIAVAQGKSVPPEVLADYPNMFGKSTKNKKAGP